MLRGLLAIPLLFSFPSSSTKSVGLSVIISVSLYLLLIVIERGFPGGQIVIEKVQREKEAETVCMNTCVCGEYNLL